MAGFFGRNFGSGLLIGCIVAVAVAAAAITYERYDTKTLKRTIRRDAVLCGVNTGLPGFSMTTRATGPASTSISAARSRRRSSTIRTR